METVRQQIVAKFTELLGEGQFVYGSFKSKPQTPYGNYALDHTNNYNADNRTYCKIGVYIYRLVTDQKDFELEDTYCNQLVVTNEKKFSFWRFIIELITRRKHPKSKDKLVEPKQIEQIY